jgi:hypothetical protein
MVIENHAGELHVSDQAGRNAAPLMNALDEREKEAMAVAPTMILGAGSQVGNVQGAGELRLVGMLYDQLGAVCVPVSDDSCLMVTTSNESFLDVVNSLRQALPKIRLKGSVKSEPLAINSAVDADQAVRAFFAETKIGEPNSIHMEDATLNANQYSWQVSGSYRPFHALRSKRYYIELDARTGAVTKFQAPT